MDPYKILGLDKLSSKDKIKSAYFKKVKEFPPDKKPIEFKEIRKAYEQLIKGEKQLQDQYKSLEEIVEPIQITDQDIQNIENALFKALTVEEMIKLTF